MTKARPGAYRFRWAIALVSLAGLVSAQSGRCQSLDSFNPSPNFWASAIVVQADGKVIFGGGFTTVTNQARGRLARVNADGTLDATFTNPNANDDVYSLALQPDGKVLVAGWFDQVNAVGQTALKAHPAQSGRRAVHVRRPWKMVAIPKNARSFSGMSS